MKFFIKKEIFMKPLQIINSIITKNNSLPILENIIFKIQKKKFFLIGSCENIEIIIKVTLLNTTYEGEVAISGNKIFEICKILPKNSILEIFIKDKKMFIKTKKNKFQLMILNTKNFPRFQLSNIKKIFYIKEKKLKKMIEYTSICMSNNDIRNYFNGLLFEFKENKFYVTGTNGHKLSYFYKKYQNKKFKKFSIILPRKSVLELNKLLLNRKIKKFIKLFLSNNNVIFKISNVIFISKIIHENFPNFKNIFIKKNYHKIKINRKKLKNSLSYVSILKHEITKGVQIKFHKNGLCIITSNNQEEKAISKFKFKYFLNTIKISVNVNYILEILNKLNNKYIYFYFKNNKPQIQIKDLKIKTLKYIIMPLNM